MTAGLDGEPAFFRIAFVKPDREAPVDTHSDAEPFWLDIDLNEKISLAPQVVTANGYVFLVLHHYHGRRSQGWFIASVNHEKISASLVQDPGVSSVTLI